MISRRRCSNCSFKEQVDWCPIIKATVTPESEGCCYHACRSEGEAAYLRADVKKQENKGTMKITFSIPGMPKGKARPRFARYGNKVMTFTDDITASYENLVKLMFIQTRNKTGQNEWPTRPIAKSTPIAAKIRCWFQSPACWSNVRKQTTLWACKKPDCDNIAKVVLDALNGLAYDDDSQVVHLTVEKCWCRRDSQMEVAVELRTLSVDGGGQEDGE